MRRVVIFGIAAVILACCAAAPSLFSDARPPERFQGGATYRVTTVPAPAISNLCQSLGAAPLPKGLRYLGCTAPDDTVFLPNPCAFRGEEFADLLCHEQGHVNGWSALHED